MGQCGCADFSGEFTLPAPNKGLYVFWRYAPCDYCQTPSGFVVCHLESKDIKIWDADKLPRLSLTDGERLVPVLSVEALASVFANVKINDLKDYDTLGDFLQDEGYQKLGEAMDSSVGEWGKWEP